jgi:hypothetical protein
MKKLLNLNFIKSQIEQGSSTKPINLKLSGAIYSTSMYCAILSDNTRRDTANADSDAGIVGHSNLKDEIYQVVIQIRKNYMNI